jgi:hypothetical protein
MSSWLEGTTLLVVIAGMVGLGMWPIALLDLRFKSVLGPMFLGLIVVAGLGGAVPNFKSHPDLSTSERLSAAIAAVPAILAVLIVYGALRYFLSHRARRAK